MPHIPREQQNIKVATDAVIFTIAHGKLQVLLIKMAKPAHKGKWAFPGGMIPQNTTSEQTAKEILLVHTGVKNVHLEQLFAFDGLDRDIIGRVVSIAYFALIPYQDVRLKTTERYDDARWWPVDELPDLAYDHGDMFKYAYRRLQKRLAFTNVVWSLLPREFTLTQMQTAYEIILNKTFDKRNFRRKMLSLGLIEDTGKKQTGEAFRPAALYKFTRRKITHIQTL